jgi:cell division transport system permease protein
MPLPRDVFQPAFAHNRLGGLYAFLIGAMVFVASFAAATETALSLSTLSWNRDMQSRMTVELPPIEDEAATTQAERVTQVLSILRAQPDIESATPVSEDDMARLLKPWIDQSELLKDIPLPALIDVQRRNDRITADDIRGAIKAVAHDAHVEDHTEWLYGLTQLANGLTIVSALIILLCGLSLTVAVNFLCRAVMAAEQDAISLLHTMGAEDDDIAKHFQFHARRLAMPGAVLGFIAALICVIPILLALRHYTDLFIMQPLHWLWLAISLVVAPLAAMAIAAITARLSALQYLQGQS